MPDIIVLSEEFYKEVLAHPIPTDLEAVKVLSGLLQLSWTSSCGCAIGVLYRRGRKRSRCLANTVLPVNWDPSNIRARDASERAMIDQWLGFVRALWPECPAHITGDGQ